MIFPIGDENVKGGFKPYFSYAFIGINIVIYIFQISLDTQSMRGFVNTYATIPSEIMAGQDYFSLMTSMFLHGSIMHIIGNMLYLWVFGDNIEAVIGNSRFLLFYVSGGLLASLAHILLNPASSVPTVGASGAIAAIMGAYFVLFPKSKIKVIFIVKIFYISALFFLGIWIVQQIFSGLQDFGPNASEAGGTAWWAHIGGFIYGAAIGWLIKKMGFIDNIQYTVPKA